MITNKIQEFYIHLFQKKPFGSLLEISPTNLIFLKAFNWQFQEVEVWFTAQNSQPLKIEDRINLTLVIKQYSYFKNVLLNPIYVKGYEFLSFANNIGKTLSTDNSQNLLDSAKKYMTDAIKTTSKRAIPKATEATGDLIGDNYIVVISDPRQTECLNLTEAK